MLIVLRGRCSRERGLPFLCVWASRASLVSDRLHPGVNTYPGVYEAVVNDCERGSGCALLGIYLSYCIPGRYVNISSHVLIYHRKDDNKTYMNDIFTSA